jgi:hypothetical protein
MVGAKSPFVMPVPPLCSIVYGASILIYTMYLPDLLGKLSDYFFFKSQTGSYVNHDRTNFVYDLVTSMHYQRFLIAKSTFLESVSYHLAVQYDMNSPRFVYLQSIRYFMVLMAQRCMEKCSLVLVVEEGQLKTYKRYSV